MAIEYLGLSEINGPLVVLEGVKNASYEEIVEFHMDDGTRKIGRIIEIYEDKAVIQVFEGTDGMSLGNTHTRLTGRPMEIGLSPEILGRTFNGIGQPIDGLGDITPDVKLNINGLPLNPVAREYPRNYINTGISAIDGLTTLIRGQKLPIFSGNGLPHDKLAAQIVQQASLGEDSDEDFAIVFAAMGVKYDVAEFFRRTFEESGAADHVVMFLNLANDPVVERLLTPKIALTAAEYLAFEKGMHILVILTDITSFCEAMREVSSSKGEIPSRKGYPGYLYSELATLYERAGIVRGGTGSMMTAYNELNGVPACMNPDLKTLVKKQWGLEFIVTDGADFSQNVLAHHSHATHAEALAACLKNGNDVMTDEADMVAAAARDALDRGLLTEADIDRAVGNSLSGRFRLGEFDGDSCPYNTEPAETDTLLHRAVNRCAAMEQMCLLHNRGILPLQLQPDARVAVIGPLGNENYRDWYTGVSSYAVPILEGLRQQLGAENVLFDDGYSVVALQSVETGKYCTVSADGTLRAAAEQIGERETFLLHDWDFGSMNLRACCNGKYVTENGTYQAVSDTPYEWFIREWLKPEPYGDAMRFGSWHDCPMDIALQPDGTLRAVSHGKPTPDRLFRLVPVEDGVTRAAALAKQADVVILCLGNHPMQVARECYDRPDLELPAHQKNLLRAVQAANPNTVLTVVSSYPYALGEAMELLPAILYTTHAGPELGNAVADTLLGKNNPAARCPITWYRSAQDLPDIMEYDIISAERTYLYDTVEPLFPFGHGLSYSSFVYRDFTAEEKPEGMLFRLTVENTSQRDGDEVVQLYYRALHPRVKRPLRQLCGFQRVPVPANTAVPVTIFVPWYALEYYDVTQEKMLVEQGEYRFSAGASSADIRQELECTVSGEVIPPRNLSHSICIKNYDSKHGIEITLRFSYRKNDWYGCTNDWGGSFTFADADFAGYTKAELWAAAPCSQAGVAIYAGEQQLGSVEILPSRSMDDFQLYTIPLKPYTGQADLRLEITGMASVYRIQLG